MRKPSAVFAVVCLLVLSPVHEAAAVCLVEADISASATTDPDLPAWTYTLVLNWNYNYTPFNHWALPLDDTLRVCTCEEIQASFEFGDPIGQSSGVPDCLIEYQGVFQCAGDPGTDISGVVLTLMPTTAGCEPGYSGAGIFVFYSDHGPTPLNPFAEMVIVNDNLDTCGGGMTGVFPAVPCNPTSTSAMTWSAVKSLYR